MRVVVLSDTHAPRRWRSCPPRVAAQLLRVAMVHDAGPATGRLARMRRAFGRADLVVFGHSHIPLDQSGYGLRIFPVT